MNKTVMSLTPVNDLRCSTVAGWEAGTAFGLSYMEWFGGGGMF